MGRGGKNRACGSFEPHHGTSITKVSGGSHCGTSMGQTRKGPQQKQGNLPPERYRWKNILRLIEMTSNGCKIHDRSFYN